MSDILQQQSDQFYITDLIARGGMADVYLAQDVVLKRQVALKVLSPQMTMNRNANARFRREAETVARLNHPHIVQIFSTGRTQDKRPFIAMEYVRGGSLQKYLARLHAKNQRLNCVDALLITRQVAEALAVAHQAGVVHRDLKPSNILLRPDGTPVVTDLGIAAVQTEPSLTQTGNVVGTPHYMSPEQARGQKIDGRSDIYSLGMILYEMLAGSVPFSGDSPLSILHQQVNEPPPPLSTIRTDLTNATCQVVEICLQKEPANRFQSADDLIVALDHALIMEQGERPAGQPVTAEQETEAAKDKRPLWLFGVAAVVLLLLCGGSFFIARGLWSGLTAPDVDEALPPPTQISTIPATETSTNVPVVTAVPQVSDAVIATLFTTPPSIDGSLDEWVGVPSFLSAHAVHADSSWDGTDDVEAVWQLGWDANNLYVGVAVTDELLVQTQSGNQIFKGDNVDLQLDMDRTGDWGNGLNTDDFQINLSPGNFATLPPSAFHFTATADGSSIDAPRQNIRVAAQQQPDGYVIEAVIPWQELNVTPSIEFILGAALNVTDNDTPGTAVQERLLSNSASRKWEDPTTWGTITLSE